MKNWLTSFCARQLAKQRQPRLTQREKMLANASPKSEQKELILILHENGIIGTAETFALIHVYGLG